MADRNVVQSLSASEGGGTKPRLLSAGEGGRTKPLLLSAGEGGGPKPRLLSAGEGGRTKPRLLSAGEGGRTKPLLLSAGEGGGPKPLLLSAGEGGGPKPLLPETAAVHWRPRADDRRLTMIGRGWTITTVAHTLPFLFAAGLLLALEPLSFPVGVILVAHAWAIPELYAKRGANVLRRRPRQGEQAERTAVGLLGDLVGHDARALHARTGLTTERGELGVWVLGEAGAVLVRPGGRRVHCYCVRVEDPELPSADRIAHLLLGVRSDEHGFATVANLAFSGARRRVRRRLPKAMRPALDAGGLLARRSSPVA